MQKARVPEIHDSQVLFMITVTIVGVRHLAHVQKTSLHMDRETGKTVSLPRSVAPSTCRHFWPLLKQWGECSRDPGWMYRNVSHFEKLRCLCLSLKTSLCRLSTLSVPMQWLSAQRLQLHSLVFCPAFVSRECKIRKGNKRALSPRQGSQDNVRY